MSTFNATFSYNLGRESNDDHRCMHVKRSIKTLIYSVILILKNYNLSFCKLLIISNCADKGAESCPILYRWKKLHQILDRTYKCRYYSSLYRTGIIKSKFCGLVGSKNIETYCRYRLYFKQGSIRMSVSATDFFIEFTEY